MGKTNNLVIVESPSKAKTIGQQKYLRAIEKKTGTACRSF